MPQKIEVVFSDTFNRSIERLSRRYRNIFYDIELLVDDLEKGKLSGDRISGISQHVRKVRIKNTDAKRGKSGGYRIIYYVKFSDRIILLTIYSKSDQSDITNEEIKSIISAYKSN